MVLTRSRHVKIHARVGTHSAFMQRQPVTAARVYLFASSSSSASTRRLMSALATAKFALTEGTARQSVADFDATSLGSATSKVMTR